MGEVRITDEMVEAARAKGRELAGNQPGALVEAMAEIAEQGARAALSAAEAENERLREALRRLVTTYATFEDGDGNPCPDVAFGIAALNSEGS
jgi:hypothetical protein